MRQVLGRCKALKAHDVVTYFGFAENFSFWKQQKCLPYCFKDFFWVRFDLVHCKVGLVSKNVNRVFSRNTWPLFIK